MSNVTMLQGEKDSKLEANRGVLPCIWKNLGTRRNLRQRGQGKAHLICPAGKKGSRGANQKGPGKRRKRKSGACLGVFPPPKKTKEDFPQRGWECIPLFQGALLEVMAQREGGKV